MHRAVAAIVRDDQPLGCPSCAILVSTASGGAQLRTTLENLLLVDARSSNESVALRSITLPAILNRDGWYEALHGRTACEEAWLSDIERSVLFQDAARVAIGAGHEPPFALGPGLIAEILTFYDGLRRNLRTIDTFERLVVDELEPSRDLDRGAARLLLQTHFLVETFRAYERRVIEVGALDEEGLRRRLLGSSTSTSFTRVVVTVHDVAADAVGGLWPADFDLLTRLSGLERIDVIVTDGLLDAGYRERLEAHLPGLDETRAIAPSRSSPTLSRPPGDGARSIFVARDREDELVELARWLKARAREPGEADGGTTPVSDRFGVVFQRPLPYLYLAHTVLAAARIPYQTFDALPLASEPFAAAVDLILRTVESGSSRDVLVALLSHPSLRFEADGQAVDRLDVAVFERAWRTSPWGDGREGLERLVRDLRVKGSRPDALGVDSDRVALVAQAALDAADSLGMLAGSLPPSQVYDAVLAFLSDHEAAAPDDEAIRDRQLRGRAACRATLEGLRAAHRRYGDSPTIAADVARAARGWIETRTFAPRIGDAGIQLVDAETARYADFDEIRILGLVESDWPAPRPRNIFYPPGILSSLGWPRDRERTGSDRAAFRDLRHLPIRAVSMSSFTLEDDRLVAESPLLESIDDMPTFALDATPLPWRRVMRDEALTMNPVVERAVSGLAGRWLAQRRGRSPREDRIFHGYTSPRRPSRYAVTGVDQYLDCPFRYFARRVLRITEEPDDDPQIAAVDHGRFIHDVFGTFFERWQAAGERAITPDTVDRARALVTVVVDELLPQLRERDRSTERRRLLGTTVSIGLCEQVLQLELERPGAVVERLVEFAIDGEWRFTGNDADTPRAVRVRGTADRIDLMADGTLCLVDYKSGQAPDRSRAVQLPIYGVCAEQRLAGYRGRDWRLGGAAYVAFGGRNPLVALERRPADLADHVRDGQQRFLDGVSGIERGEFPPRPAEPLLCDTCSYPAICRKDFVHVR